MTREEKEMVRDGEERKDAVVPAIEEEKKEVIDTSIQDVTRSEENFNVANRQSASDSDMQVVFKNCQHSLMLDKSLAVTAIDGLLEHDVEEGSVAQSRVKGMKLNVDLSAKGYMTKKKSFDVNVAI